MVNLGTRFDSFKKRSGEQIEAFLNEPSENNRRM